MPETISYERLHQILHDYVMNDFEGAAETEYVRDILLDTCGCTEAEIEELGFGFLLDTKENDNE